MISWWSGVVRFAIRGLLPETPAEVPVWAMTVPFRMWGEPYRYHGRTFAQHYGGKGVKRLLPLRTLYLLFLLLWPLVAFSRALSRGTGALRYLRHALARPDLAMPFPDADFTDREAAWGRPDYPLAMFYAREHAKTRAAHLRLDDKRFFLEHARRLGLPLPPTFTPEEAVARGGRFIVKDPDEDLGYGVDWLTAEEIAADPVAGKRIIQERLRNHPDLRAAFSDDAPLSTLRVTTLLDAAGEPGIARCAVRIGRAGALMDNTAQGGIWAAVDPETGRILPGVTKKTFGRWKGGTPIRFGSHPDTKISFVGLKIPWWDEGRALALDAHRRLAPYALSLGWDVAQAEGGPVLLEVNVWTTCYDYDPPDDAFTPACERIVERLRMLSRD